MHGKVRVDLNVSRLAASKTMRKVIAGVKKHSPFKSVQNKLVCSDVIISCEVVNFAVILKALPLS